ncbi:MAG: hypothetical protein COB62_07475 [Piscirickettsiaceae bacterium]|nr:MAG: hypothetical protein COB62_07475 [Piscirickettsiaceae bacterium]
MKRNKGLLIALPLVASVFLSHTILADDTEIFFNQDVLADTEDFQPNILFIFDTSGSMGWNITSRAAYNPSTNYCTGTCNNNIYVYSTSYSYKNKVISSNLNSCKTMTDYLTANTAIPVYIGKAAEWRKKNGKWKWRNIKNATNTIECQEDAGIHGVDDSSTDIYAANGNNGPYSSSANDAASWSNINNRLYVPENYHQYLQTTPLITRVKMDVMKEAAIDLVNEFSGLNFGLMRFDGSSGGYVKHHFSDIETDRTNIVNSINALTASGNTPLSETLWEAHKYFLGGSVEYGTNSNRDAAAVSGGNYNSPVADSTSSCQSNYVVYLTDGQPYSDSGRDGTIRSLTNTTDATCDHSDGTSQADNTCLDELSGYMASHDYNLTLDGTQNVVTHTIGFAIDMDLLEQTAINGNGTYHTANSSQELKSAFNEIILDILSSSTTFTAPAVSVNAYNSLQHRDELYYATFEPNIYPRWVGNVKKYRINSDGEVLDANNQIAIEPTTGYFKTSSESFWGGIIDGPVVKKSGVGSQLTNSRTVFTVVGDATLSNISLNVADNTITLGNTLITNDLYGIDEDAFPIAAELNARRLALIGWITGIDVDDDDDDNDITDANNYMADPLHSRPIVVTYDGDNSDPDNITLDDTLFATTNSGTFHAVNTSNGQEIFAFIPQDLLPNQLDYFLDDPDGIRRYGLDGPMTIWRKESTDDDIKIESSNGDHVYAYFGMRRGGGNYYAMDVTNRNNPKLMWTIFGGTTNFQDMGQSWSRPILSQVNWGCDGNGENCTLKDVLFFAGGYDTIHDNATVPTSGDKGAAIYMIDAVTGALLWSAGNNSDNSIGDDVHDLNLAMSNSIPGDVTVADMDGDGSDDILFAVDIEGHVWRIDFNSKSTSASDFAENENSQDTGAEIADLSDSNEFRRFYTGPTVSLSQKRGREPFFVLTIGTGYTAHPKNTDIDDRLYAIFEYNIFGAPEDSSGNVNYTTITNSALLNLTDPASGPANPESNAPHGFYKDATANGEKFLRSAATLFGYTVYTSYLPEGNGDNVDTSCGAEYLGGGRIYAMNFVTGESAYTGEYINLKHPGIPPEPVTLFIPDPDTGGTTPILCVGTECFSPDDEENPWSEVTTQILYWRENIQ